MKNKRKMKSSSWILSIVLIIVISFVSVPVYAAQEEGEKTTIAFWNFENSNLPEDASEENKEAEWIADTEKPVERKEPKNPPSGTEQGKVLETVGWKEGKSWRTVISTEGWQDVKLSYVQRSSNTGAKYWKAEYSLDGSSWKTVSQEYAVGNDWTTGKKSELTLPTEAENQKQVYIRLIVSRNGQVVDDDKTISGGGYSDLDDVKITGNPYNEQPGILRIDYTAKKTGGNYWWSISKEPYVFQSGDVISYDVYLSTDAAGLGGVEVYCTGNGMNDFKFREHIQTGEWIDQEGISGIPSTDISDKAYGKWYHRELSVPASAAGFTLRDFCLGIDNGLHKEDDVLTAFYDNIKILRNGVTVFTIYEDGEPSVSQKVSPDNNTSYEVKLEAVRGVDAVLPEEPESPDESEKPLEVEAQNFGVSLTLGSEEMKASTGYQMDKYTIRSSPEIREGTVYVPLYPVMEAFGADVQWDGGTQTVTIRQARNTIIHKLGTDVVMVNGEEKPLNPEGSTVVSYAGNNSSIMVPSSFFEYINGKVSYGEESGLIKIVTPIVNVSYPSAKPEKPIAPLDIPVSEIAFRFVVSSDSQGVDEGLKNGVDDGTGPGLDAVLNQIKNLDYQPQFIIGAGDLVAGTMGKIPSELQEQLTNFRTHYTKVFDINTFLPVIGNHEQKGSIECQEMFTSMFSEFTERQDVHFCEGYNNTVWYYDDVKSNTRIFALNTNNPKEEHKITGKQLEWLKSNINPAMGQNIFIMHEPAYSTWHYGNALDRQVQARDEFWDVVERANNPMVFCGHEHLYSRKLINSRFDETIGGNTYSHEKQVYQIHIGGFGGGTNGTANNYKGVVTRPESMGVHHFAVVDILKDGRIHVQAIDKDGNLLDEFVQAKEDTERVTPGKVSFKENEVALERGEKILLEVTENVKVNYKSGDETVARVDNKGNVTAVGKGITYITATAQGGNFAACKISVGDADMGLAPDRITVTFDGDAMTERGFTWYTEAKMNAPVVSISKTPSFEDEINSFKADMQTVNTGYLYKAKAIELDPETEYYYRVGDSEKDVYSSIGTFTTGKSTGKFSFIHLTDTQADNREEAQIAANTLETALETVKGAEFIVHGGDIVENGSEEEMWKNFLNLSQKSLMNTTLAPIAGNHEKHPQAFTNHFKLNAQGETETGVYYSYDYSNAHFAILNTNDGAQNISEKQLKWLKEDVTSARAEGAEWVIVGMHKGPYSTGSHVDDEDIRAMRKVIVPLMDELDIDLVLEGHDHVYARTKILKYDTAGIQYGMSQGTTVITESDGEMKAEYMLATDGTIYLISNSAGAKLYGEKMSSSQIDLNKYWTLFEQHIQPAGQSPKRGELQNFTGITIEEGRLKAVVYELSKDGMVTVRDSFGIDKEVPAIIKAISQLPKVEQITLSDKEQIQMVRKKFNELTDEQKIAVGNLEDLEKLESRIEELENQKNEEDQKPGSDQLIPKPESGDIVNSEISQKQESPDTGDLGGMESWIFLVIVAINVMAVTGKVRKR